jgi:hypothetical protein
MKSSDLEKPKEGEKGRARNGDWIRDSIASGRSLIADRPGCLLSCFIRKFFEKFHD